MRSLRLAASVVLACLVGLLVNACAKVQIAPHLNPVPEQARMLLGKKGMREDQPIFVRIFKAESELEVWKQREDGYFHHFKTYPICNWSGALGPKHRQGDKQSPEGFYQVAKHQMNPNSQFHLSFDLGYPNAFDRSRGRTGDFLMVHGKCRSAGCYAMTDALIEEIYALAREAFAGGQERFHVHAFPFRMTPANMARVKGDRNYRFWQTLKQGYDYFETTRRIPNVEVCAGRYHVNVEWDGGRLDPNGYCPAFKVGPVEPYPGFSSPAPTRAAGPGRHHTARFRPPFPGATRMSLLPRGSVRDDNDPIAALLQRIGPSPKW